MERQEVIKHIGKKVLIILDNNYKYTAIIPPFEGDSFSIIDIFGEEISITCDFISAIFPKQEERK